jgi:putative nucleotidyltransferase with HDIG domain
MHRRRSELVDAKNCCERAYTMALDAGELLAAAEAANATALVHLEAGEPEEAQRILALALALGAEHGELRGRIEQNLGVLANIQGDVDGAIAHYGRSLEAFTLAGDQRGCAIAYHNLGMANADHERWDDAERYYRESLTIADTQGDAYLRGLNLLNRTEVLLARQRYQPARESVEEALRVFDQLGARDKKAGAYTYLGMLFRETGNSALAEARLRTAMELAREAGSVLNEAEATREMALLHQSLGRNQDALRMLNTAHRLFRRLDARRDLVDVAGKVSHLEGVYLEVVRGWGQSIESTDSYTFGHSERVARYGATVGRTLGLDEFDVKALELGAYLHDLGKVRVPHEILNKPGRLTNEEFAVMKKHPEFGVEMLAGVEFPWDILPVVRSHHEKVDGTGYPDALRGDELPLAAQVICVVDVYDALTTTRSYRGAMTRDEALAEMQRSRRWWRDDVFEAFLESAL